MQVFCGSFTQRYLSHWLYKEPVPDWYSHRTCFVHTRLIYHANLAIVSDCIKPFSNCPSTNEHGVRPACRIPIASDTSNTIRAIHSAQEECYWHTTTLYMEKETTLYVIMRPAIMESRAGFMLRSRHMSHGQYGSLASDLKRKSMDSLNMVCRLNGSNFERSSVRPCIPNPGGLVSSVNDQGDERWINYKPAYKLRA